MSKLNLLLEKVKNFNFKTLIYLKEAIYFQKAQFLIYSLIKMIEFDSKH